MHAHKNGTSKKQLILAWAGMMALSTGTMIAGRVNADVSLGPLWAAALMLIAGLKARLILAYFLGLRTASKDWNGVFNTLLFVLLALILAAFLAGNWLPALQ